MAGDHGLDQLAQQLAPLVSEEPFHLGIEPLDAAIGVYGEHGVGRGLEERLEHFMALPQGFLGPFYFGDIA